MKELLCHIEKLAQEKLEEATTKHPAHFASAYEAYAVLLQEVEEAQELMENLVFQMKFVWDEIKMSPYPIPEVPERSEIEDVEKHTLNLAAQAVMILTVCKKFSLLLEGEQACT